MKSTISLIFFVMLLSVQAAGFPKSGTTAAPFLKIGVGARAVAMGGNFTALANDATALYWNPAGILQLDGINFSLTHTEWFAGISHDYFALTAALGDGDAIGLDMIFLTSGDIEQTTLQEQDGNGIFYDASDVAIGFTYARALTDQFQVAVKAKYIQQTIYNEESSSLAIDFGTIYKTEFHGLIIGMNLANFGGNMQMTGNDLTLAGVDETTGAATETVLNTESWPLPIVFRVGIAMDLAGPEDSFLPDPDNRLTLAIDGTHPNDNSETIGMGVEYEWKEMLALRMGYKNNHDVENLSFGGGFKLLLSGVHFTVDYAYADFGDLDQVQRFTAGIAF